MNTPRHLTTVSTICLDPEGLRDPVRVDISAETTANPFLVVAPQPARFGPFEQGFTGAFVVIHTPSGQPVVRTDRVQDARELAGRLAAGEIDWSQAELHDTDVRLRDHVDSVITRFHAQTSASADIP